MRAIPIRRHLFPALLGVAAVAVITFVLIKYEQELPVTHLVFVYLLPIAVLATFFGSTPAVATALVSIVAADFFLLAPRFDIRIQDPLHVAELVLFSILALLASMALGSLTTKNS